MNPSSPSNELPLACAASRCQSTVSQPLPTTVGGSERGARGRGRLSGGFGSLAQDRITYYILSMRAASVRPITDLKNKTKELVQEVADGGEPLLITQNGKPKVVVMAVAEHDRLRDTMAMLKLLAQSQESLARGERISTSAQVKARAHAALARAKRR